MRLIRPSPSLLSLLLTLLLATQSSLAFGLPAGARSKIPRKMSDQPVSSPLFGSLKQRVAASTSIFSSPSSSLLPTSNEDEPEKEKITLSDRLLKLSNIASLLCVVDCTVLPIVTLLFPLLGLAASPTQMEWLHELGHKVAMYFVIPVGGTAATMNFVSHKRALLSAPALLGLCLIYLANGHGGPILSRLPHEIHHLMHHSMVIHRTTNILGCALLIGSNYVSHKATHQHGPGCSHHHH